jgi:hypothetical protein
VLPRFSPAAPPESRAGFRSVRGRWRVLWAVLSWAGGRELSRATPAVDPSGQRCAPAVPMPLCSGASARSRSEAERVPQRLAKRFCKPLGEPVPSPSRRRRIGHAAGITRASGPGSAPRSPRTSSTVWSLPLRPRCCGSAFTHGLGAREARFLSRWPSGALLLWRGWASPRWCVGYYSIVVLDKQQRNAPDLKSGAFPLPRRVLIRRPPHRMCVLLANGTRQRLLRNCCATAAPPLTEPVTQQGLAGCAGAGEQCPSPPAATPARIGDKRT